MPLDNPGVADSDDQTPPWMLYRSAPPAQRDQSPSPAADDQTPPWLLYRNATPEPPPSPVSKPPAAPPPVLDDFGRPVDAPPPDDALSRGLRGAFEGFRTGLGEGAPGIDPQSEAWMRHAGLFEDPTQASTPSTTERVLRHGGLFGDAGQGGMPPMTERFIREGWAIGDELARVGKAGYGAYQGFITEALPGNKGRDLASVTDAMAGMPYGLGRPHVDPLTAAEKGAIGEARRYAKAAPLGGAGAAAMADRMVPTPEPADVARTTLENIARGEPVQPVQTPRGPRTPEQAAIDEATAPAQPAQTAPTASPEAPPSPTPAPKPAPTRIRTIAEIQDQDGVSARAAAAIQTQEIAALSRPITQEEMDARRASSASPTQRAGVAAEPPARPSPPAPQPPQAAVAPTRDPATPPRVRTPQEIQAEDGVDFIDASRIQSQELAAFEDWSRQQLGNLSRGPAEADAAAPGFTRFYHGGTEYTGGTRWLSQDPKYAAGYAAQTNGHVYYVDIPNDSPLLHKTFDDTGTDQVAPYAHFDAPAGIASKLRLAPQFDGLVREMVSRIDPGGEPGGVVHPTPEPPTRLPAALQDEPAGPPKARTPNARRDRQTPLEALPQEPERLTQFLIRMGGLNDVGGDVRSMLGGVRGRPGLLNGRQGSTNPLYKNGVNLDDATLRAWEHGYFPEWGENRPTTADLLEKLDEDVNRGRPQYSHYDEVAADNYRQVQEANEEIIRLAAQHGINLRGLTREQFWDRIAEHASVDDLAHEIASREADHPAAFADMFSDAREEGWRAQGRTLAELEDEHRQEQAAAGTQYSGSDTEGPHPLAGGQGQGQGSARQGGRDIGPAGGAGAEEGGLAEQPAPFYSAVARAVDGLKQARGTGEQMLATLQRIPGVKPEEMKWLGLDEWLKGQKSVTKEQIQDYVRANALNVQEVVRGGADRALEVMAAASQQKMEAALKVQAAFDKMDRYSLLWDGERLYSEDVINYIRDGGLLPSSLPVEHGLRAAAEEFLTAHQAHQQAAQAFDEARRRRGTKYHGYTTKGGENYHELLLTLPPKPPSDLALQVKKFTSFAASGWGGPQAVSFLHGINTLDDVVRARRDSPLFRNAFEGVPDAEVLAGVQEVKTRPSPYQSSHWDEPNVLAHIRFDEHQVPAGKGTSNRVLMVQEIQSDLHQSGRKAGYIDTARPWEVFDAKNGKVVAKFATEQEAVADRHARSMDPKVRESFDYSDARTNLGRPYEAPFKTSWPVLAMKRAIQWAVDNGFDRVEWSPGDVHEQRYWGTRGQPQGNGMRGFYDGILPTETQKLIGKYGAKVERVVDGKGDLQAHGFDITPKLRDAVQSSGQSLFAGRRLPGTDDMFGPTPEKAARRPAEPTIRDDPNQVQIPGTEPTAKQAQAARDQTGRGGLMPKVDQQAADEGLFKRPEPVQESLPEPRSSKWAKSGGEGFRDELGNMSPQAQGHAHAADWVFQRGRETGHEHIAVVDNRTGEIVHAGTQSEKSRIAFDHENTMAERGAYTIHHNHPNDTALSGQDLAVLGNPGISHVVAHGHDGTTTAASLGPRLRDQMAKVRSPLDYVLEAAPAIREAAQKAGKAAEMILLPLYHTGKITLDEANKAYGDVANRLLHAAGTIDYSTTHQLPKVVEDALQPHLERAARGNLADRPAVTVRPSERVAGLPQAVRDTPRAEPAGGPERPAAGPGVPGPGREGRRSDGPQGRLLEGELRSGTQGPLPIPPTPQFDVLRDKKGIDQAIAGVKALFSPTSLRGAKPMEQVLRKHAAEQAQSYAKAVHALETVRDAVDRLDKAQQVLFTDRMERGQKQATPELQRLSDALRQVLDHWTQRVQSLGRGYLQNAIQDYMGHIWGNYAEWKAGLPPPTQAEMDAHARAAAQAKQPLRGSGSFLKQRTFPTQLDGINKGLVPVTFNPVDLQLLKLREMQKWYHGTLLADHMKQTGLARWVPAGMERDMEDAGFRRLDDRVFQPRLQGPANPAGFGRLEPGNWYAPEPVERLFRNYMSRSLMDNVIFDAYRSAGNALNLLQLSLSGFHAAFVTMDTMVSRTALGIEQVARGQMGKGAVSILMGATPASVVRSVYLGSKLKGAWLDPANATPEWRQLAERLNEGGGRVSMDRFYRTNASGSFFKNWADIRHPSSVFHDVMQMFRDANGPVEKAVLVPLRMVGRVLETVMEPIMGQLVPRVKLGVFTDMARDWQERHPNATPEERSAAMIKAWDSVDNRLGQMVYDNVFWDKTMKDLAFANVRSVGWNLGTVREIAGGGVDAVKMAADVARGRVPQLTHRMAYVMALPLISGVYGAIVNYLGTGEAPQSLLDLYYPRTGTFLPNGEPERRSIPGYMKDVFAYKHAPGQTVLNKLHPVPQAIGEVYRNRDYYGGIIYDSQREHAIPAYADYLVNQAVPFSLRGAARLHGEDATMLDQALNFWGLQPAPKSITQPEREAGFQALADAKAYKKRLQEPGRLRFFTTSPSAE